MTGFLFDLQLASTALMTGVIWFVQLIHYRWFHDVPADRFESYHAKYTSTVGIIVGPAMMVEFLSAVALMFLATAEIRTALMAGLILLVIIWSSTAFLQVPCHAKLAKGYNAATHAKLVRTNWIRTIGWTARLALLLWLGGFN